MNSKNTSISKSFRVKVGITMGDPSGIGSSIIIKAIERLGGLAEFVIIGDEWVFDKIQNPPPQSPPQRLADSPSIVANMTLATEISEPANYCGGDSPRIMAKKSKIQDYKFIDLDNVPHKNFKFGKIRAEYGKASLEYLDKALELIANKEIDCLVTCPISKEAINLAGFKIGGHTEYLAKRSHNKDFVMMLLNRELKISLVTRHIPLGAVPLQLNKDKIYKTILLTYKSLKELFLIKNPRIVVCGLNPHASDNGLIGKEENRIIKPVLRSLKRKIVYIDGPLSADVAIAKAKQKKYDCVIAMYHDQALIPLKILGSHTGVNITLGLGVVRTSPLHGTAFDIAGNHTLANPASLMEAIRLAVRCTLNLKRD